MSNTGGIKIIKKVQDVWKAGKIKREDLTVNDFDTMIELGAFNEEGMMMINKNKGFPTFNDYNSLKQGGLHGSNLIERHLIDMYVPFLPMEKRHVRLCIEKEFRNQNYSPRNMDEALE